MSSNSDFSSWDDSDLNLDLLLGDYTSDVESGDDYVPCCKDIKHYKETATASACKSERQSIYQCPECDKTYSSVSGFRGHLRTKHSLSKITEEENSASPFGVRSRLPAMSVNLDSDMNRSLIDLTPSGEVQMRVNREKHDEFTSPRAQAGATEKSMQTSTENIDVPKLKQELNEIRRGKHVNGFIRRRVSQITGILWRGDSFVFISKIRKQLRLTEQVVGKNKWDNGMKAYELATSLRGVAQGIVTDIEPAKRLNYDYLVSALTSRFEPANQVNMYKVQMNSIYRKPSQTLPEMAQEIRRVTRQAYPTAPIEIRDQLAKDCFVRAINDPKIQLSIFQREPKTIDDCVRFGLEYEAFTVDQKRLNNAKPATRMLSENDDSAEYDVVTRLAKISEQMEKLTNKEGQNFSRMTCFYCGNKGHIKKECRKFEWDNRHNCVKRNKFVPNFNNQNSQSNNTNNSFQRQGNW
ncbi:unnamed protein product [Mytilus edulis]|uniref:Uncharacterized protein n=1 Tax=Mytilus edulis TaxID=6550 RepID=A0A8S3RNP5_MYTED|nr:unnamed protein product [Mytilus edulis]